MVIIGLTDVKAQALVHYGFKTLYGVGSGRASRYHFKYGAHCNQRLSHTTRQQRKAWVRQFKHFYCLGPLLKMLKRGNTKRLKYIKCYRGVRHASYLPVRGQRTHSNRRTSRYLSSGTWQYVPALPGAKLKKVSKYVRHKPGLVEQSNSIYQKLLQRSFASLQKNKRYYNQLARHGKLAQFAKLAKQKISNAKKATKSKK